VGELGSQASGLIFRKPPKDKPVKEGTEHCFRKNRVCGSASKDGTKWPPQSFRSLNGGSCEPLKMNRQGQKLTGVWGNDATVNEGGKLP